MPAGLTPAQPEEARIPVSYRRLDLSADSYMSAPAPANLRIPPAAQPPPGAGR